MSSSIELIERLDPDRGRQLGTARLVLSCLPPAGRSSLLPAGRSDEPRPDRPEAGVPRLAAVAEVGSELSHQPPVRARCRSFNLGTTESTFLSSGLCTRPAGGGLRFRPRPAWDEEKKVLAATPTARSWLKN